MRSTPPRASSFSPAMSYRRYLKLVLPRFATRTFTPTPRALFQIPQHLNPHADRDHDAADDRRDQRVASRRLVLAGTQTDDAQQERQAATEQAEQDQHHDVRVAERRVEAGQLLRPAARLVIVVIL